MCIDDSNIYGGDRGDKKTMVIVANSNNRKGISG